MRAQTEEGRGLAGGSALGRDARVIGLITVAHFFSHFYILALPPLFPVLSQALGVGATQLGIALAVLNIATGLLQAPMGFLVDRYGAAVILILGQAAFGLGIALIGIFPLYGALLVAMAIGGIGNSVYHPADYAILSGRVEPSRMGRAFAVHTFGGYAGFAAAPLVMVTLNALFGWQPAFIITGGIGLLYAAVLWTMRGDLTVLDKPATAPEGGRSRLGRDIGLLLSWPVLMAFAFFVFVSASHTGFTSFTTIVLERGRGFDLVAANLPLTLFLVTSALGVLVGGWVADWTKRHVRVVALCCLIVAAAAILVAIVPMPLIPLAALFLVGGLASGIIAPSRDTIVRSLAPAGQTGKVFGFVMTGFNVAGLFAPPLFGLAVDFGLPSGVFWLVAVFSLLTILTLIPPGRRPAPA